MPLIVLALDNNAATPSWLPIVALLVPLVIVLAVLVPALRARKRYGAARRHERSARQQADTSLGSATEIADAGGYSTDALLKALAIKSEDHGPVGDMLVALAANAAVWQDMRGFAGPDGIVIHRGAVTSPGFWVYDLWLAKRIARGLELKPLPPARIGPAWKVPYGLSRSTEPSG